MAMQESMSPVFASHDPVWSSISNAAAKLAEKEPVLAGFLHTTILGHERFEDAFSYHLAQKLGSVEVRAILLREVIDEAFSHDPDIPAAIRADIVAVYERDPACSNYLEPVLYFKGFHALEAYRVGHWLYRQGRTGLAFFLQNRISQVFGLDIHPAARIGRGIMIDHGTGVVIGETAVVEDSVSFLHGVTLGGTGKEGGDRHPKVRQGVMIGAGAGIFGNIEIGERARVGAGSVVLRDVPANCTAAGVPAQIVGCAGSDEPAREMNQNFSVEEPDYSI